MGYDISIHIPEEGLDERFKNSFHSTITEEEIDEYKEAFLVWAMQEHKCDNWLEYYRLLKEVKMGIKMIANLIHENWKESIKSRLAKDDMSEENEIWFCGWCYAEKADEPDPESVIKYTFESIFEVMCNSKYVGYFDSADNSGEDYSEKINDIKSKLDYLSDQLYEDYNKELVNFYRKDSEESY